MAPPVFLAPIPVAAALYALRYSAVRKRARLAELSTEPDVARVVSPDQAAADGRYRRPLRLAYRGLRNVIDRGVALVALVPMAPVLLIIALVIWLDSGRPVLFRQQRIGIEGRHFTMVKFRTLTMDAPSFSLKLPEQHSTVTRFGRFLRRSGLDELPQLWNVVKGDMAIIGPRPEQAELISFYEPWQRQRELIRPGITGWWQIHHRDGMPLHKNIEKDLYYIQHQSPWLDLLILIGTMRILLYGFRLPFSSNTDTVQLLAVPGTTESSEGS